MTVAASRERLRIADFDLRRLQNGRCRSRVVLELSDGRRFAGTAEELASAAGELRCAARATLDAIGQAAEATVAFELLGVKAVRAFDATVVIVSLTTRHGATGPVRLVGSFITDDASPRGAALAVLNATNRTLGNLFSRADKE